MKSPFKNSLLSILALSTVYLVVSCAPKGMNARKNEADRSKAPTLGGQGTSDSGGGTGLSGKVFESYIVDPTQLPAYKTHLEPLFANIKPANSQDSAEFHKMFIVKTWYVAPVELHKIDKAVLGVSFMKSDTQQIARQTSKEVWIDKAIFEKMSSKDQAELLLHELVMNMYLLKFLSMKEICRINDLIMDEGDTEGCGIYADKLDKTMPPVKTRPLNEQDNENIRYVTGWLLQNARKPISEKKFATVLVNKGFDRRLFNPRNYEEDGIRTDTIELAAKELFRAVKGAEMTGHMPDTCYGLSTASKLPCEFTMDEVKINFNETGLLIDGYKLQLQMGEEKSIQLQTYFGEKVLLNFDEDEKGLFYSVAALALSPKVRLGDRIYTAILIFRSERLDSPTLGLELESIAFIPGIVYSIDKKRQPICLARKPKADNILNDTIIVQHDGSTASSAHKTLQTWMEAYVSCSEENVVE